MIIYLAQALYMFLDTTIYLDHTKEYGELVPIPVAARSKAWVCARSHAGIAGSNPAVAMNVSSGCRVLSGTSSCDGPIACPEKSYRVGCVWVWSRNLNNVDIKRTSSHLKKMEHCWNEYRGGNTKFSEINLPQSHSGHLETYVDWDAIENRVFAVTNRRITAWAMAWSVIRRRVG